MVRVVRSEGFILYDGRQQRYMLTVFDRQYGKLRVLPPRTLDFDRLHGAFIEYELSFAAQVIKIADVSLVALPTYGTYRHMLLMHHILELIQFLSPEGAACDELYDLLRYLSTNLDEVVAQPALSKILVGKIFFIVGGYEAQGSDIDDLVQLPLTALGQLERDICPLDRLDAMVSECLVRQPYARHLKTVRFVKEGNW